MSEKTIFAKIMDGDVPADIVYEDSDCIAINDISPKAPVHVLIIPRKPIPRLVDATEKDRALLGQLMLKVGDIARQLGVDDAFRVVINNGESAGQTIFHLHLHLLAKKRFTEGQMGM